MTKKKEQIRCPKCGSSHCYWFGDETTQCQNCKHVDKDEKFEVKNVGG